MLSDLADLPAIQLTETDYLRFETDTLSDFGREIAEKELRETPDIKPNAIAELRSLLKGLYRPKKKKDFRSYSRIEVNFSNFVDCFNFNFDRGYRFIPSA